jgi:PAS domain S-box-containing protein
VNAPPRPRLVATVLGLSGAAVACAAWTLAEPRGAALALLVGGLACTGFAIVLVGDYARRYTRLATAYHELHRATLRRERSEAALRETERFLRSTLDAVDAMIAVLDADGVVMATNRAWRCGGLGVVGVAGACDVGASYAAFCERTAPPGLDGPRIAAALRQVMSGGFEEATIQSPAADGRVVLTRLARFAGHGPVRVVVTHHEAPAGPAADTSSPSDPDAASGIVPGAGAEHARWVRSPDLLCLAGPTHFVRVNPALAAALGRSPEELVARPYLELVHPDDRLLARVRAEQLAGGEPVVRFESRYAHRDGRWRWIAWTAFAEPPDRVSAIGRDVTEAKETAAVLRALYERAPCGLATVDPHGAMVAVNETMRTWLGYAPEALADGRPFADLVAPASKPAFDAWLLECSAGGGPTGDLACDLVGRDGTGMPVVLRALLGGPGASVCLAALDARAGQQAAALAAELAAQAAERVRAQREREALAVLVTPPVLDLARDERPARVPVDMAALARDVSEEVRRLHPGRDVTVQVDRLAPTRGDPGLLRELLAKLLDNAFTFTRTVPHPCIDVGSVDYEGRPVYYVRDNGAGFDAGDAAASLDAFERLEAQGAAEGHVGLAIVRRVVERHGGRVWAEGRPGEGATFYFTLGGDGAEAPAGDTRFLHEPRA